MRTLENLNAGKAEEPIFLQVLRSGEPQHQEVRSDSSGDSQNVTPSIAAPRDWLIWQLADSAFPTGGFAHSNGLEAAWRHGEVPNGVELASFIESSLRQFCRGSLPLMAAACREPRRLVELDGLCQSLLLNHVANRASRAQGRSLLSSAERIFNLPQFRVFGASNSPPYSHLAPAFGFISRTLGVEFTVACRLFMFLHLRGLIASAVRLGIVGPLEGQTLQNSLGERAEEMLGRYEKLSLDDVAQVSPLLDIWHGTHDKLYSRLFQS